MTYCPLINGECNENCIFHTEKLIGCELLTLAENIQHISDLLSSK